MVIRKAYEGEAGSDGVVVIKAHYDGRVMVPDEPVDLPQNQVLIMRIEAKNVDETPARVCVGVARL